MGHVHTHTNTHTDRNRRAKRLDLNLLISQQHPNDLNISFNARPTTLGFSRGWHAHPYLQLNIINFNMFILFISNAFFTHTHTNLSACLVLYPNFARIRVSSFRNTPVCVCVCVYKVCQKVFPCLLLSLLSSWSCVCLRWQRETVPWITTPPHGFTIFL